MYIGLTREEFENKLKAGDIDFKLLKNKLEIQDTVPVVPLMNSLGDEGDLEPTDTMYEKHFREATGSDYVLGGVTRLCTQLLWYKKWHILVLFCQPLVQGLKNGILSSRRFILEIFKNLQMVSLIGSQLRK